MIGPDHTIASMFDALSDLQDIQREFFARTTTRGAAEAALAPTSYIQRRAEFLAGALLSNDVADELRSNPIIAEHVTRKIDLVLDLERLLRASNPTTGYWQSLDHAWRDRRSTAAVHLRHGLRSLQADYPVSVLGPIKEDPTAAGAALALGFQDAIEIRSLLRRAFRNPAFVNQCITAPGISQLMYVVGVRSADIQTQTTTEDFEVTRGMLLAIDVIASTREPTLPPPN